MTFEDRKNKVFKYYFALLFIQGVYLFLSLNFLDIFNPYVYLLFIIIYAAIILFSVTRFARTFHKFEDFRDVYGTNKLSYFLFRIIIPLFFPLTQLYFMLREYLPSSAPKLILWKEALIGTSINLLVAILISIPMKNFSTNFFIYSTNPTTKYVIKSGLDVVKVVEYNDRLKAGDFNCLPGDQICSFEIMKQEVFTDALSLGGMIWAMVTDTTVSIAEQSEKTDEQEIEEGLIFADKLTFILKYSTRRSEPLKQSLSSAFFCVGCILETTILHILDTGAYMKFEQIVLSTLEKVTGKVEKLTQGKTSIPDHMARLEKIREAIEKHKEKSLLYKISTLLNGK